VYSGRCTFAVCHSERPFIAACRDFSIDTEISEHARASPDRRNERQAISKYASTEGASKALDWVGKAPPRCTFGGTKEVRRMYGGSSKCPEVKASYLIGNGSLA
jgi:hypothetical protein